MPHPGKSSLTIPSIKLGVGELGVTELGVRRIKCGVRKGGNVCTCVWREREGERERVAEWLVNKEL